MEKRKLDDNIGELDAEIDELARVLERKRKQKEMLQLEKQVHEKKIEAARMKYADVLEGLEARASRVANKIEANEKDQVEYDTNSKDLEEQQQLFNLKVDQMREELKQLREMQTYLNSSSGEIDEINQERKEIRT